MTRTAAPEAAPPPSDAFVLADPGMAAALLSGTKTRMRILPHSPLAGLAPGSRVTMREPCIAARMVAGQVHATALSRAEFVIFADGERRHRDGATTRGRPPTDTGHSWITAMHMPHWASRATLTIESARVARLGAITPAEVRAEGAVPLAGGLLWRWPRPIPGLHASARRAFASYWNRRHAMPGTRWEDDPEVVALHIHVEEPGE